MHAVSPQLLELCWNPSRKIFARTSAVGMFRAASLFRSRSQAAGKPSQIRYQNEWVASPFSNLPALAPCINDAGALPKRELRFRAFHLVRPADVRVLVLGMDPYRAVDQADGLAFSYSGRGRRPQAVSKIFARLWSTKHEQPLTGSLAGWAAQGVLLLNAALTVTGRSGSDLHLWHRFSTELIQRLIEVNPNSIFVVWGVPARRVWDTAVSAIPDKSKLEKERAIFASHPCASKSRQPAFSTFDFESINRKLSKRGARTIDWRRTGVD